MNKQEQLEFLQYTHPLRPTTPLNVTCPHCKGEFKTVFIPEPLEHTWQFIERIKKTFNYILCDKKIFGE